MSDTPTHVVLYNAFPKIPVRIVPYAFLLGYQLGTGHCAFAIHAMEHSY